MAAAGASARGDRGLEGELKTAPRRSPPAGPQWKGGFVKIFERMTQIVFGIIGAALMVLACGLILYAGVQVLAVFDAPEASIGETMLDSIGYMVIAIAVFEVAKYILEEEVFNPTENRHTGEARRSITKFVSTIIIAIFLEALVAIFQASKDPAAFDRAAADLATAETALADIEHEWLRRELLREEVEG